MRRSIIPPIVRLPANASDQEREEAYIKYILEIARLNNRSFLPVGVKASWFHKAMGLMEHPQTRIKAKYSCELKP